jgi:hypothetical protein
VKPAAASLWEHRGGILETDSQTGRRGFDAVEDIRLLLMGQAPEKPAEHVVHWDGG